MFSQLTPYVEYLSWRFSDEPSDNEYQILIEPTSLTKKKFECSRDQGKLLISIFRQLYDVLVGTLTSLNPSDIIGFLDYQYSQHCKNNPGKELAFLIFIHEHVEEIKERADVQKLKRQTDFDHFKIEDRYANRRPYENMSDFSKQLILEWIDKEKAKVLREDVLIPQDKRIKISHAQQMLLLERLGVLEYLKSKGITTQNQAKIISILINKSEQNTREFLTYSYQSTEPKIQTKKQYFYKTPENTDFIDSLLSQIKLF